ncbi:hypothetical protein FVEN_g7863 [Fusarium venenatum]|nr:hypothetical protein FVEN_g7863 [Fusarium venenatum]
MDALNADRGYHPTTPSFNNLLQSFISAFGILALIGIMILFVIIFGLCLVFCCRGKGSKGDEEAPAKKEGEPAKEEEPAKEGEPAKEVELEEEEAGAKASTWIERLIESNINGSKQKDEAPNQIMNLGTMNANQNQSLMSGTSNAIESPSACHMSENMMMAQSVTMAQNMMAQNTMGQSTMGQSTMMAHNSIASQSGRHMPANLMMAQNTMMMRSTDREWINFASGQYFRSGQLKPN